MRAIPLIALVLLGCETESYGPPTCDGGGEPLLELGDGGRNAFAPHGPGAVLPTRGDPIGLDLDLWTSGIDTTQPVTAVVRISVAGGPTEDSLASLTLICADSGNGWTNVLATLPSGSASGTDVAVEAVLTDWTGVSVTAQLDGTLE